MTCSLHLITDSGETHLEMPPDTVPGEILDNCKEGMMAGRVIEFVDTLAPGSVHRTTVVVNFSRVTAVWVDVHPT